MLQSPAQQPFAPSFRRVVRLPDGAPPVLVVAFHVEEEFDWDAPFDRASTSVESVAGLRRAHAQLADVGARPAYMIGHPVATQPGSVATIRELLAGGNAEVGVHLHPWVCPPHSEIVSARNSYPCNLGPELEATKIERLAAAIEEHVGVRPRSYLAGRYGIGPHSAGILERLGFEVDLSPAPPFDLREDGGPDFSRTPPDPYWFGERRELLSIPTTGGYVGWLWRTPRTIFRVLDHRATRWFPLRSLLAKAGVLERIRLTPEGQRLDDMRRLTEALRARGVQVFSVSVHSPSTVPGHTPYVRTEAELETLLADLGGYCRWFLEELGGIAQTPLELKRSLESAPGA